MSESAPEPAGDASAEALLADAVTQPDPESSGDGNAAEQPDAKTEPAKGEDKDWAAEAAKWKALARKHEQTAKTNQTAAQRLAEIEDAQKTEQQRLADRLAAAEQERDDARRSHARLMAAATHNIPADLIDRIGGNTDEEIEESAQALVAALDAEVERRVATRIASLPAPAEPAPAGPAATRPVESLTPGGKPASEPPTDPNTWLRRMAGRSG